MFSNTTNLRRCRSYADAQAIFKSLPIKPPRRGRPRIWADWMRPLGSKNQWHYRVEQEPSDGGYVVWLYRTAMARFYPPDANGNRRVVYRWDRRTTSKQFMRNVCHVDGVQEYVTTDGRKVAVPLENGMADLWFDANGRLDVSRSSHTPAITYRSNAQDRERRAAFRKEYGLYAALMALRHADAEYELPEPFYSVAYYMRRLFGPFTSPSITWRTKNAVHTWLSTGIDPTDSALDALSDAAKAIIIHAKGKAEYDDKPMPSQADLEKRIVKWMIQTAGKDASSERVELPQFPEVSF